MTRPVAVRDEFLSEDDLDLASLSDDELIAWWNRWLEMAQASNADDAEEYAHGVFCGSRPRAQREKR